MATVVEEVARVRRLEMPRQFEIALDLVADAVISDVHRVLPPLLLGIGGAVEERRGARAGLGDGARAVKGFARLQHAPAYPSGGVEVVRRAASLGPALFHATADV